MSAYKIFFYHYQHLSALTYIVRTNSITQMIKYELSNIYLKYCDDQKIRSKKKCNTNDIKYKFSTCISYK